MSYVTFRKIPNHSICTEWKFEGCLNFEINNTHQEKTTLLHWNYWHFTRFSTEGQQKSTYLLFWKEFWNRNQSVAMWLVSRQQFHSLLQGNNAFFCFCKCCLYWVNPSMFNSDNILWTINEKTHLQKPEHNTLTSLNSYLEKRDASYTWQIAGITFSGCWLERLPTFMKHTWSIPFILWINMNSFLHLLPHLKGLDISKVTSVSGNTIKGWNFHWILMNIPSRAHQESINKIIFSYKFFTLFLFGPVYKKVSLSI